MVRFLLIVLLDAFLIWCAVHHRSSNARALPKVLVTVSPIATEGGGNYAHHNNMGLVWLKFKLAPLCMVSIQEQVMIARMQ